MGDSCTDRLRHQGGKVSLRYMYMYVQVQGLEKGQFKTVGWLNLLIAGICTLPAPGHDYLELISIRSCNNPHGLLPTHGSCISAAQ